MLSQVGRGLRHLHSDKVFHRDLAARNVLVKGRTFKVTDFGLSSVVSDSGDAAGRTSTIVGPIEWRAPETFHLDGAGQQVASVATDVYMLGGLMLEVLTAGQCVPFFWLPRGAEPRSMFRARSSLNTLDAAAAAGVSIPWAVVPGDDIISGTVDGVERLKTLMARCLHAEPSRRPSMDDFLADLDAISTGDPSPAPAAYDCGYGGVPVAPVSASSTAGVTPSPLGGGAAAAPATATATVPSTAAAAALAGGLAIGAASQAVDVVDMSEALAAMEALHIAADVSDRVCDEIVLAVAEVGHVTGTHFLQIVVDEGIKTALAMKLREKLRITSAVPPRRVRLCWGVVAVMTV